MKRVYLMAVAIFMSVAAWAQNIAVVSPTNSTDIYQTLDEAIAGAEHGSTIYLPGGGFQIKDETKIDKKLTIMGVSHRGDTDNVDGATVISGRLNFVGGSSSSAVVGVFVSGNIDVGEEDEDAIVVKNLTLRYCNANSIQVKDNQSSGMVVNQCYLRNPSDFGKTNANINNSIVHSIIKINGGKINHNIVTSQYRIQTGTSWTGYPMYAYYPVYDIADAIIYVRSLKSYRIPHSICLRSRSRICSTKLSGSRTLTTGPKLKIRMTSSDSSD